ncbi:hypothetical protein J8I29_26790 [Labrys sp. LIt4]|uniref:DUF885 domain-containing protein n=1 Tax=Labrys okinawensis TaxID=346911 RepID=A0A2S9QBM2_9HYPH|nr:MULTISPECIES: hypothetical protein [Labrys]MBP0582962.1 hypothetical protein [Labrys sp. LIt4]PRH86753.1 hypothetical protein C5L14_15740 [Labrys okinawensis]
MHAHTVRHFARRLCLASSLALSACFLSGSAGASDDQVKLTAPMVEKFIAARGELAVLAADLTKKYGDRSDTPGDDPVASLPAFQDIAEAKTRTDAILTKYDFKDLDTLDIVTNSVMLAYQADVPDNSGGNAAENAQNDPEAEKAKARAEIEADQSLTPEKRKEALQQLDEQFASLQALTPLPGNAEVVKPFLDRLKPIAEAN